MRPRLVVAPDGERAIYRGWEQIAAALDCSKAAAFRASRRTIDPLRVRYDFADRPWIYRDRLQAWVEDSDRSARQYDLEKRHGKNTDDCAPGSRSA